MTGPPDPAQLADAWLQAVNGTSYVPMSRMEKHRFLRGLAKRLGTAVRSEPADPMAGYWAATEFVAAGFDAPEALGATIAVLDARLLPGTGDPAARRHRLTALLQAFATGYARALRDRTFDAQDEIRIATFAARARAERELAASEARARHASLHDPLTGLPNRTQLVARLRSLAADPPPSGRLGLCHIGIDGFDAVKRSLGPRAGDELLLVVAERLRGRAAGRPDRMVARLGDAEFAILVENTTCVDDAAKVADRALASLGEPFRVGGLDLPVSARCGVVERELDTGEATGEPTSEPTGGATDGDTGGAEPIDLLQAADLARHWARADGTSRWVVYDPRRGARDVERYRLSAALPQALRRREFVLEYQPLVSLRHATLAGVEALARWRHPTLGLLGPDRFVGLAEDTGLIVRLGIQLLEQACQQAASWDRTAADSAAVPFVSVNLAVSQLRQPGLAGEVAAVLDRTGLAPHRLQLEITETAVIDPDDQGEGTTIGTLRALASLGVRLAVDDFGTGYSNLSYLPVLPLHGLKLAGSFLTRPGPAAADHEFLANLVALSHALGLTVTGEGVETPAQAGRIRAAGCDLGQGWHFGRPVPAEAVDSLVGAGLT